MWTCASDRELLESFVMKFILRVDWMKNAHRLNVNTQSTQWSNRVANGWLGMKIIVHWSISKEKPKTTNSKFLKQFVSHRSRSWSISFIMQSKTEQGTANKAENFLLKYNKYNKLNELCLCSKLQIRCYL